MQISKTLISIFIIFLMLLVSLPAYSVKLVEEEEVRKSEAVQETPPLPEKMPDYKKQVITEERRDDTTDSSIERRKKEEKAPIRKKERSSAVKKKSTQSNEEQDPKASTELKIGFGVWVIIAITVLALLIIKGKINTSIKVKERKRSLIEKYGENEGLKVFNCELWRGMTTEQLLDMLGEPADKKDGVYQQTYYYGKMVGPRHGVTYKVAIIIKNGVVYTWKANI